MAGNIITQFLVGIGISYDDKGAKRLDSAMDDISDAAKKTGAELDTVGDSLDNSVKRGTESSKSRIASLVSTFKAAGFAMAGVAAGVGSAWAFESDKAKQAYNLNNQLATSRFSPTEVYGLGALTEQRGGNREDATNSLLNLERGINRIQTGDAGLIQQLAVAGIRIDNPTGRSREDVAKDAMGQFQHLDTTRQSNVAEILGLDPATVRVWQEFGSSTLDVAKAKAKELGYTEQHNAALNQINQTILDTQQKMEGLGNSLADVLAPAVSELAKDLLSVAEGITNWLKANPNFLKDFATNPVGASGEYAGNATANWIQKETGWNPQDVGQKYVPALGQKLKDWGLVSSDNHDRSATPQQIDSAWSDIGNMAKNHASMYNADVGPAVEQSAQQSQQLSKLNNIADRPIQVNNSTRVEGNVTLDGNVIGKHVAEHFETNVYPQAIDNTKGRSY